MPNDHKPAAESAQSDGAVSALGWTDRGSFPTGAAHRLIGTGCACGEWAAGCGNDVQGQWVVHLRDVGWIASRNPFPPGPTDGGAR